NFEKIDLNYLLQFYSETLESLALLLNNEDNSKNDYLYNLWPMVSQMSKLVSLHTNIAFFPPNQLFRTRSASTSPTTFKPNLKHLSVFHMRPSDVGFLARCDQLTSMLHLHCTKQFAHHAAPLPQVTMLSVWAMCDVYKADEMAQVFLSF